MSEPSAYVVQAHISWEEAISTGVELRRLKDNSQWELGDLALTVEGAYGTDAIGKFANEIGLNKKSLQQYRRVSQAFEPKHRVELLSHRHHLILTPRPDRLEWLKKCADDSWSTLQLTRELALADGKEVKDIETSPDGYRCSTCEGWFFETDDVCSCVKYRGGSSA